MRQLLLSVVMMVGSFAFAAVSRTSVFDDINIDKTWNIKDQVVGAKVTLDTAKNSLILTLEVDNCPPGAMCIARIIEEHKFEAPVIKTTTGACGEVVVKAMRDDRPVDGSLVEISLVDNTSMTCETLAPLKMTTVNFKSKYFDRRTGKEVVLKANFGGPALQ